MLHKWEIERSKKVVAVDIDGVLNNYPQTWVDFVNKKISEGDRDLKRIFNVRRLKRSSFRDLIDMKDHIPYNKYRELKRSYRESGIKETLPVSTGAKEFLDILHNNRYTIFIITARPFNDYPGLFRQTVNWLDKNGLYYDDIVSDDLKHVKILSAVPALNWLVDDNRYIANLVSSWGYKTYLMNNVYNKGKLAPMVKRVSSLKDILIYEKLMHDDLLCYEGKENSDEL